MYIYTDMDFRKFYVNKDKWRIKPMIEVSKEVGRYLKQHEPKKCVRTTHKRHYYAQEDSYVKRKIAEIDNGRVVYTYPEKE